MNLDKIKNIVEELQLDYLEFVEFNIEERKKLLPITNEKQISNIIYNLVVNQKIIKKVSVNEYTEMIRILINQIKK